MKLYFVSVDKVTDISLQKTPC